MNVEGEVSTKSEQFLGVESMDGRLVFKDETTFKKTMQYLYEHQEDEFVLDRAFVGFKSYLKAYVELADKDFENFEAYPNLVHLVDGVGVEKELTTVVEFELLKSALNPDGLLQIGDMVYKYSDQFVYQTSNASAIPLLVASRYSLIADLKKSPIVKNNLEVSNRGAFYGVCESFFVNNTKRKVRGQANALSSLGGSGYQEIFLKTQALKKHWWGWATYRHDELVIRGSGEYTRLTSQVGYTPHSYSYDRTKFNTHGLKIVIAWNVGYPYPYLFLHNNTFHDARWDIGCTVIIN